MSTQVPPREEDLDRVEKYLEADPKNPRLLVQAIDVALALGDFASARKHANAALDALPGDPYMQHRHANVLVAEGRLDEAAQVFSELFARHGDPNIAYNLGVVRFRQGRADDALKAVTPITHVTPPRAVALALRVLHAQGKLDRARDIIAKESARCSQDAEFLGVASLVLLDGDDAAKAGEFSRAALAKGERPLEALVTAASLALARREAAEAQGLFQEALRASPREPRTQMGLGMAKLLAGDPNGAKPLLESATKALPHNANALEALAWARVMTKDLAEAEEAFQQLQKMPGRSDNASRGLAVTYALQGRGEDATRCMAKLNPDDEAVKMAKAIVEGGAQGAAKLQEIASQRLRAH
jgi:predicted Zn-dependent protease